MSFELARPARALFLGSLVAALTSMAGCSAADANPEDEAVDPNDATTDAITEVDHSAVKRQSIGNCWIYATASWSEAMNKRAQAPSAKEPNFSESYWTYWHWFEQIANGDVGETISTGGSYGTAAELISRYGVMSEGDFIASEKNDEMSDRQAQAQTAINESLKSGALSTDKGKSSRSTVRKELNKAFGLSTTVVAQMNRVFGASTTKTLDKKASTTGTKVQAAKAIPIKIWDETGKKDADATLADAIGTRSGFSRSGPLAWNEFSYPGSKTERRNFQKRFQKALQHGVPVMMSWYVDFNAMEEGGQFKKPPTTPGRQGGHMVAMSDYQVSNVPGFGLLPAGTLETRDAALTAALDDKATIDFIRIKNSWGSSRPDRHFEGGYHDLWMEYLNGPVKQCEVDEETDMPKAGTCFDSTPLDAIVLPPGL